MRQKLNVRDMTVCALFTTLTAVGAFIKIPVPVVPFTLQFLFTTMAGDWKLCNRFADRNLAAVSLLFSAGCTGGHCPVHTGGGSRQTDYPGSRY